MPTYDYVCSKCGHIQEEFHQMLEKPEVKCEDCESMMKKTIHGGTGFSIKTGGTIKRTMRDRYGKKVTENMATPTEAAKAKAQAAVAAIPEDTTDKNSDPYHKFR